MKNIKTFSELNEDRAPMTSGPDAPTLKTEPEIGPRGDDGSGDRPRSEGNRPGESDRDEQRNDAIELCYFLLDNNFDYSLTTTVIGNVIESYIGRMTPEADEIMAEWREIFHK